MAERARRLGGPRIAVLAIAALVAGVIIWMVTRPGGSADGASPGGDEVAAAGPSTSGAPGGDRRHSAPGSSPSGAVDPDDAEATSPAVLASDPPDRDQGEYPVDLDQLRQRLPDNLYWRLGAPTQDPDVLQARQAEEKKWNALLGKVQSTTATEAEVHEYYEHRRQLSTDYIEFATTVLEEYGDRLPERDRGMYQLSIEMHTTRLAEIPRQIDEVLARMREKANAKR